MSFFIGIIQFYEKKLPLSVVISSSSSVRNIKSGQDMIFCPFNFRSINKSVNVKLVDFRFDFNLSKSSVKPIKGPKLSHSMSQIMQSHIELTYPGVRIKLYALILNWAQCVLQCPVVFFVAPLTILVGRLLFLESFSSSTYTVC